MAASVCVRWAVGHTTSSNRVEDNRVLNNRLNNLDNLDNGLGNLNDLDNGLGDLDDLDNGLGNLDDLDNRLGNGLENLSDDSLLAGLDALDGGASRDSDLLNNGHWLVDLLDDGHLLNDLDSLILDHGLIDGFDDWDGLHYRDSLNDCLELGNLLIGVVVGVLVFTIRIFNTR